MYKLTTSSTSYSFYGFPMETTKTERTFKTIKALRAYIHGIVKVCEAKKYDFHVYGALYDFRKIRKSISILGKQYALTVLDYSVNGLHGRKTDNYVFFVEYVK